MWDIQTSATFTAFLRGVSAFLRADTAFANKDSFSVKWVTLFALRKCAKIQLNYSEKEYERKWKQDMNRQKSFMRLSALTRTRQSQSWKAFPFRCIAGRVTMLRALTMTVRLPAAFRQPVTIPERLKRPSSLWLIWIWQWSFAPAKRSLISMQAMQFLNRANLLTVTSLNRSTSKNGLILQRKGEWESILTRPSSHIPRLKTVSPFQAPMRKRAVSGLSTERLACAFRSILPGKRVFPALWTYGRVTDTRTFLPTEWVRECVTSSRLRKFFQNRSTKIL